MDPEVKTESTLAENPEIQSKNGLLYVMPQSLSSSTNKTFIRQQSQRQSYNQGDTMVFDMNTGDRYIDPENCMLMFDVRLDGDVQTNTKYTPFKSDVGALALMEEIHIHAKSGVELDRIDQVNQYAYTRAKLRENGDYWDKWATIWGGGFGPDGIVKKHGRCGLNKQRIVIPMKILSGLFDPTVKGMKMPPGLLSGARIEITLEGNFGRCFGAAVDTQGGTRYFIDNPVIVCMAHELSDNSQRVLNEESVENGLEYTYTRVFTTVEPTTQSAINIQIKKAVSRGIRAFAVPVATAKVNDQVERFSFNGLAPYSKYQWRVGSQFYPQQKIDTISEGYWTTLNAYNKSPLSSWFSSSMSFDEYSTAVDTANGNLNGPNYIMGAGFETDSRLNLTGVPINNSATLTLEATMVTGLGADSLNINWYVFLEYSAVARSFLTNVEVKI